MSVATVRFLLGYVVGVQLVYPAAVFVSLFVGGQSSDAAGVLLVAIPLMVSVMLAITVVLARWARAGSQASGAVLVLFVALETWLWWRDGTTHDYDGVDATDRLSVAIAVLHAMAVVAAAVATFGRRVDRAI